MGSMVLTALLRQHGHTVEQRDLDIEHLHDPGLTAGFGAREQDIQKPEYQRYFESGGADPDMDALLDKILYDVPLGEFDLIGISAKRPFGARLLAKRIKEISGKPIVVGGDLGAAQEDLLTTTPQIDYFISGRGEVPLLQLMTALESGAAPDDVPGLISRDAGRVRKTKPCSTADIAQTCPPDLSGLRPELYLHQTPLMSQLPNPGCRMVMPYYFIEGCPFHCSFCRSASYGGARAPEEVAAHLDLLSRDGRCRDFIFLNNALNVSSQYALSVCKALVDRGLKIRWTDSMRPDNWNPALIESMARAGCVSIVFGIESGSDQVLKRMNRRNTVKKAAAALKAAHRNGIINRVNFIVGFPGESHEDFLCSLDFVQRNAEFIDSISISEFYLVQSDLTAHPEQYGIRIRDEGQDADWDGKIPFDEIGGMDWETRSHVVHDRSLQLQDAFHEARGRLRPLGNLYEIFELMDQHQDKSALLHALRARKNNRFFLFTGTACNNHCPDCIYANYHGILKNRPAQQLETEIAAATRSGYDTAVLVGGEPALRNDFFDILDLLDKQRFAIVVETNGRILYYRDFVKRLARYRHLELAIHGLNGCEAPESPGGAVPESILQIARGIKNCLAEKVPFKQTGCHFLDDRIPRLTKAAP